MSRHTRRRFLANVSAATAALALTESPIATSFATAEKSTGFRYAMCNESFEGWPQAKIFHFLAACGYGAVEIAPFTIQNDVTEVTSAQRAKLRDEADAANIRIVGLHWLLANTNGLHLTSPDEKVRADTTEYLCALAKFCSDLGGDVCVFGSPKERNVLPGVRRDQATAYAVQVLRKAMPTFEQHGVVLALEPLSPRATNFMTTAAEAVELAEKVNSPNCKLLLDCNAMNTESSTIPELIRKFGSWLVHFHANDPNSQGPGMGTLDFVPILTALREIAFRGWISVEVFDFRPGPERIARESIEYMRKIERLLG